MKIYVDADASPATDMVVSVAKKEGIPVVLVKNYNHFSHEEMNNSDVEVVYVDANADAADYRIVQLAQPNDVIITQDYGLASLGLGKGCAVLHHKGFAYTNENIGRLLETRHASAKARRAGKKTKGPKPYTNADRATFQSLLINTIQQLKRGV